MIWTTERGFPLIPSRCLARRGGRYPEWAPTVAVGAARRLRCDAQRARAAAMPLASGAPAPLLHGFSPVRPWRAPRPGLHAGPARQARKSPQGLLPVRARPLALLRFWLRPTSAARLLPYAAPAVSPRHKSPTPGTAHRAALLVVCVDDCLDASGKAVAGSASAATLCGAEHRRAHGRARAARASTSDSRRLFDHSERSERREFRRGPGDRGPQGSRPAGPAAVHERRRTPGRGFASLDLFPKRR